MADVPRTTTGGPAWTEDDERWADRFRLAAALHHELGADAVEGALAQVAGAVEEARVPAEELFGDPDEHAEQVADGLPPAVRATAGDDRGAVLATALVLLGLLAVLASGVAAVEHGWWLPVTGRGLVGVPLLALVAAVALVAARLRRLGRLRASWAAAAVTAALVVGTAVVLTGDRLDDRLLGEVPVLGLGAGGIGLVAAGVLLPTRPRRLVDRSWSRPADAWYRHLEGLLRGRHSFPRQRARELTAEARSLVAASGATHPTDELGAPEEHALALADASGLPGAGRRRGEALRQLAVLALASYLVVQALLDDAAAWRVAVPAVLAAAAALALGRARRRA